MFVIFRYFIAWKRRIKLIELKKILCVCVAFLSHQPHSNTSLLWVALRVRYDDHVHTSRRWYDVLMWSHHDLRCESWATFSLIFEWFSSLLSSLGESLMPKTYDQDMSTTFCVDFSCYKVIQVILKQKSEITYCSYELLYPFFKHDLESYSTKEMEFSPPSCAIEDLWVTRLPSILFHHLLEQKLDLPQPASTPPTPLP